MSVKCLCYLLMLALTLAGEAQGPEVFAHARKCLPAKYLQRWRASVMPSLRSLWRKLHHMQSCTQEPVQA